MSTDVIPEQRKKGGVVLSWDTDEDGNYSFKGDVKSLGFTDEELEAIEFRISLRLSYEDLKSFIIQDEGFIYDPYDDEYLRLPTGRVVLIPYDIYVEDILSQVD
ncbi:hypothetical protein [Paenibacillus lemnae]|uniref:Uncharacterized protein n=1 Tax=Paenibacillus lemnae TaxID=1330551 RepID=A0A848MAF3_PAELE|nr:hypothetical protein [Paenibacillus lemnae]NMO98228.1 hypothetical protein [Paenibacillus lemnae]